MSVLLSQQHTLLILIPASWYKTKKASKPTTGGLLNYDICVLKAKHITILNGRGCFSCSWTGIVFLQAAKRFLVSGSAFQIPWMTIEKHWNIQLKYKGSGLSFFLSRTELLVDL